MLIVNTLHLSGRNFILFLVNKSIKNIGHIADEHDRGLLYPLYYFVHIIKTCLAGSFLVQKSIFQW